MIVRILIHVVGVLVLLGLGYLVRLWLERVRRQRDEAAAANILEEAKQEADRVKKEAEVSAKEEIHQKREEFEKETSDVRRELRELERRLTKREDGLDRKWDLFNKKERHIENLEKTLAAKRKDISAKELELEGLLEKEKISLHQISALSQEDARKMLMERLEKEMEQECAEIVNRRTEKMKETLEQDAKQVLTTAIQRCAADHTAESVVTTIELSNDDMKGRIIGREGRNIRAFEKATGIDVIVDDTPGVVVLSGFDSVRREMARMAMEKLIVDGRIHPARIEEVVQATEKEMEQIIQEAGRQACFEVGIHGLNSKIVNLIGRLKYRTSYGQNQLLHSIEVTHLAANLAGELGLDVPLAKRCAFLHDIGKALDHQTEGSHAAIGADVARRCEERPEVVNAIAAHHEEAPSETVYAVLVNAADAISAGRPGARRETLEKYIKRLERLEAIATSFSGVDSAYAIQAGREVRVIVNAEKVNDKLAQKLARDIAKEIEQELNYPGEITVTVIRETRAVDYAR
ncbi:MAG: ribonuclease Y [Planctomycetes bacterium]|nr:ribonuclease Y [Planctomycetota bacterium]